MTFALAPTTQKQFRSVLAHKTRKAVQIIAIGIFLFTALIDSPASAFESPQAAPATLTAEDYARAERFIFWNYHKYVDNADIRHYWIGDEDRFWYRRTDEQGGKEFVVVDATTGERAPAFDHGAMATALSAATGDPINASALPFSVFRYTADKSSIEFLIGSSFWTCKTGVSECSSDPSRTPNPFSIVSPDGKWAASVRDSNVWIQPTDGGDAFALTEDGVEHHGYGTLPGTMLNRLRLVRRGIPDVPQLRWSPDSKRLLTFRMDEREVKSVYLVQSVPDDGGMRPKLHSFRYAMPGDEAMATFRPVILDVVARRKIVPETDALFAMPLPPLQRGRAWWSTDGGAVFFISNDRYSKTLTLNRIDPATGDVTTLVTEKSSTYVQMKADLFGQPVVRTLVNGDVVWYSERDGWGNLYLYSATGKLKNRITRGKWNVRSIWRVDEEEGRIYFSASGREQGDPYRRYVYSIGLNGRDLRLLTPEPAEHALPHEDLQILLGPPPLTSDADRNRFSPSGRYFVDSYSTPDTPPVFVLRDRDGNLVKELEKADISKLEAGGYVPIEPFTVMAADGKTPIYGNLFRPSTFDPSRKYPVIDAIYPGPNMTRSGKSFGAALYGTFDAFEAQSLAELGFIVVTIDGRGTPLRSRKFVNYSYGRPDKASDLEDHIAGLRQLAERHPYMDLDRVGIDGVSGGGFATARALLTYPEFYKVGVSSAGNHDQRAYNAAFWNHYLGPMEETDGYELGSNPPLAENLKGDLLLITGDMDDNVHPTMTLKLADALIKANKDFDLMIVPNADHAVTLHPYVIRRKWDYFVRNLLGAEPPNEYEVGFGK